MKGPGLLLVFACVAFGLVSHPEDAGSEAEVVPCAEHGYADREAPVRIFDAFPFFQELDMLELRLFELYPVVHRFVIVEATHTHSGKPKDLLFPQHKQRFSAFEDKIIYGTVDLSKECYDGFPCGSWGREKAQREELAVMLLRQQLRMNDVVFLSDLDELFPRSVAQAVKWCEAPMPLTIPSELYYYSFRWRITHTDGTPFVWMHPQAAYAYQIRTQNGTCFNSGIEEGEEEQVGLVPPPHRCQWDLDQVRELGEDVKMYHSVAGWHCSYFGGVEVVKRKLGAFAHTEMDKSHLTDAAHVKRCVEEGVEISSTNLMDGDGINDGAVPERQPSWATRRPLLALQEIDRFEVVMTGGVDKDEDGVEVDTVGSCDAMSMFDARISFNKAAYE